MSTMMVQTGRPSRMRKDKFMQDVREETAKRIAEFLDFMGEQKDDGVLLAAADWVRRGDWKNFDAVAATHEAPDVLVPPGYP